MTEIEEFQASLRKAWEPFIKERLTDRMRRQIAEATGGVVHDFAQRYGEIPIYDLGLTAADARAAARAGHWVIDRPDDSVPDDAVLFASGWKIGEVTVQGQKVDVPIIPTGLVWMRRGGFCGDRREEG